MSDSLIDNNDKKDFSRYIYNDRQLGIEISAQIPIPIKNDSIVSGRIYRTEVTANKFANINKAESPFNYKTFNTNATLSMKIMNNDPKNTILYGINLHPFGIDYGGFISSLNVSANPFFLYKGFKLSANVMHIYEESSGKWNSNTLPYKDQKSYGFGFNAGIPLFISNSKSNQFIDLEGELSVQKVKLNTLKYLTFEIGFLSKNFLYANNSDHELFFSAVNGDELQNPYFHFNTQTLKTGFSYNFFNSSKLIPLDERFNTEKQKSYLVAANASLLY